MNNRLKDIIQYRTNGHNAEFAELMGWTPQYLCRILREGNIGIRPVVAVLQAIPEIDARWFILGEGNMITSTLDQTKERLLKLFALDKYICVMSPDELRELQNGKVDWDEQTISRWQLLYEEKQLATEERYREAYKRATLNQNNSYGE